MAGYGVMEESQLVSLFLPDFWPGLTGYLGVTAILQMSQLPAVPLEFFFWAIVLGKGSFTIVTPGLV